MIKKNTLYLLILFHISFITSIFAGTKIDSIRAITTYDSGVDFLNNSQFKEAIDSFLISSQLREKLYSKRSYDYGIVQNALGVTFKNFGDLNKSLLHFLDAEQAYKSDYNNNKYTIARLYNNIGNVYKSKLDFGSAFEYFQRAVDIYMDTKDTDIYDIADFYYNIADIKYLQKDYDHSLQIIENYKEKSYSDTKLYFMFLRAIVYQELNQYEKANESYLKAINYAKTFYSENDVDFVFDYLNYSVFLIQQNQFKKAEDNIILAKQILDDNKIEDGIPLSFYYKTIGYLYNNLPVESKDLNLFKTQKTNNMNVAIDNYKEALNVLGIKFDNPSEIKNLLDNTSSFIQSLELLKMIADTYTEIFDVNYEAEHLLKNEIIQKALDYYEVTSDLIQHVRKEIYSDENKIQLSELEEATFRKIVQTAYKSYEINRNNDAAELAFTNAERMKASSVFDHVSDQFAKENSLIPDSITDLERILNYNITSYSEKLYNLNHDESADNQLIRETEAEIFKLKKERDELNKFLENNYKDYYELKYAGTTTGLADVRQTLKNNEVILEYVLNENDSIPELYVFLISIEEILFEKIPIDTGFIKSIENVFRFMANPDYLFTRSKSSKLFCTDSYDIYKKLLLPFESNIKNKKITIIPDGKLNYLPFEALLTEMPDTSGVIAFNKLPYLVISNPVNYSFSAGMLLTSIKKGKSSKNRLLAFAPKYYADTIKIGNDNLVLTPLPGTQAEVNLISKEMRTSIFRNEEASEKNFRIHSKKYDILHLAMHAFINDSLPAFSRFAFSQNHNNIPENDGWLNTADIYNLELQARLTVLSACNTGVGKLQKGEGLMSLARGFIYAGCPNIIMTMWEVEDNAGTQIMSYFYKNLKKGKSTGEALRLAKLTYLEQAGPRMAHPHYWLSFISIGNNPSLFISYDYYFIGLLILALTAIAANQYIRYIKIRNRKKL